MCSQDQGDTDLTKYRPSWVAGPSFLGVSCILGLGLVLVLGVGLGIVFSVHVGVGVGFDLARPGTQPFSHLTTSSGNFSLQTEK